MGLFDFFKSKEASTGVTQVADDYKQPREQLFNFLKSWGSQGGVPTYSGERVAGATDPEKQAFSLARSYANNNSGSGIRTAAQDEIEKTLTSGYDPSSSPFYQAYKAEAARNLQDVTKQINAEAGANNAFFSGARLKSIGDAGAQVANQLNLKLGELADAERERRLGLAKEGASLADNIEGADARKAAVLQQLGGYERGIDQTKNDALYDEFNTTNRQIPLQLAQILAQIQQSPLYTQNQYQPSMFQQILDPAAQIASAFILK